MLREILPEITGFSPDVFSLNDCLQEFNAKFGATLLRVNSNITYIRHCAWSEDLKQYYLRAADENRSFNLYEKEVKEILPFRPKVGTYFTSDNLLVTFSKTARRMYKKSLSIGENYTVTVYNPETKKEMKDYSTVNVIGSIIENRNVPNVGYISKNNNLSFHKGIFFLKISELVFLI